MKTPKPIGILVILSTLMLFAGCDFFTDLLGDQYDDYGQNDTIDRAYEIQLATTYQAEIRTNDSKQFFKFTTAHAPETYDKVQVSVTVPGSELMIRLELFGADGGSLDTVGRTTGGQDMTYTFATPGDTFYIRFSGQNQWGNDHRTSGSYTFRVENLDANDDYGPNHTLDQAHQINLATDYDGVLVSRYEADFYAFTTAHQANTYDQVRVTVTVPGDEDLMVRLELFGADGGSLNTSGTSTSGQDHVYTFSSPGGAFYLRFSGRDKWGTDHRTSGSYRFRVENLDANDDFAPNHTIDDAYPISLNTNYDGVLVSRFERDFFVFAGATPGFEYEVSITVPSDSGLYIRLEYFKADKGSFGSAGVDTAGQDLVHPFTAPDDTFYLRFSGQDEYGTDHRSSGPYVFRVEQK